MLENTKIVSEIIFAIVGSVIAILTYRAAKETILQPVRTEVIKQQTDLLINMMSVLGDETSLLEKVDYHEIIKLNLFSSLVKCGSIFNNHTELNEYIDKNRKYSIFIPNEDGCIDVEIISSFSKPAKNNSNDRIKDYESAIKGQYKIKEILLTEKYYNFISQISQIARNPFLPKSLCPLLNKLSLEIITNIKTHLKAAVENSVNKSFLVENRRVPNHSGVFNEFNHIRIDHAKLVNDINSEIRKYLKIDSMP